jgi:manganese/zinc/iron transport system permease protein
MTLDQIEIQLIAAVVAAACALPGVFLVLRRMAMLSDAISHTVLLGIVLAFFAVSEIGHPLLIIGAAAVGVLTVSLTELLNKSRLVKEDAAIGLVFPALFSIAVILIGVFARNVHLDTHIVFQGELAFTPFDRFIVFGLDLGPRTLVVMSVILLVNIGFIALFYKELKLATFDASLAAAIGFSPTLIHYLLMTLVSFTAVGAFDAVGSILVIALMIVPPAAAYLLTNRLPVMLGLSALIGITGAIGGYWLARFMDTTIAGAMVTMIGVIFGLAFLFSPRQGLVALARRRIRQKWEFAQTMLAIHLLHHADTAQAQSESRVDHLWEHLRWQPNFAEQVIRYAERKGVVRRQSGQLLLTDEGYRLAQRTMMR